MLTRNTIIEELIKYDSEHPATLGEMADRRQIYATRLEALSVNADVVVRNFTELIGDGINRDYTVQNPFRTRDVIAKLLITATGEELGNPPDIGTEHIYCHFSRPIELGEVTLVVSG